MTPHILIINGPNLNLIGKREPEMYGAQSYESYFEELQSVYDKKCVLSYYQSNIEGELIDKLHEAQYTAQAIVINAGGYTHTSVAIADAILAIKLPCIEVHISNIYARESFRHHSFIAPNCLGTISGLGLSVYKLAISHLIEILSD
jgi:3-dehydroquinate dehydratase-2